MWAHLDSEASKQLQQDTKEQVKTWSCMIERAVVCEIWRYSARAHYRACVCAHACAQLARHAARHYSPLRAWLHDHGVIACAPPCHAGRALRIDPKSKTVEPFGADLGKAHSSARAIPAPSPRLHT